MAESLKVIVVGAGMAGLGTALALRKIGCQVTVLEQAPEFGEVRIRSITYSLSVELIVANLSRLELESKYHRMLLANLLDGV